jgi:hypothetical protein
VRRHYLKEYQGLVTFIGPAKNGRLCAPDAPGLGVELEPAVLERADVVVRMMER